MDCDEESMVDVRELGTLLSFDFRSIDWGAFELDEVDDWVDCRCGITGDAGGEVEVGVDALSLSL
jgi:hypothetical protein